MPKVVFVAGRTPAQRAFPVIAVVAFSALLALSAKIEVPFWPVPMTLETFAVLGLAGVFGLRLALAAVLVWLAEGAAGIPVFAGPAAGFGYFVGPTAGYLLGFVIAAVVVGAAADRGLRGKPMALLLVMLAGLGAIYLAGVTWLAVLVGWEHAFRLGILPFIPADLTKVALATVISVAAGRSIRRG
ncbi:MAG: biotin transporter BioY [Acetobacteraceae bacterium]